MRLPHAPRQELGLQLPSLVVISLVVIGRAVIAGTLAGPTKRVGRDLRKAPAHGFARIVLAVLDDVVALGASDLARIDLAQRVAPEDVPRIDPRVVDAQRRAVEDAGQNSDILNGAAFEHPREMDLALAFVRGAVVAMNGCGKSPMPDQPAVEAHLAGAVNRRLVAMKRMDERAHGRNSRLA